MKKLLILLGLLSTTAYAASTFTTNYNLEKPQDGSTAWGEAIRDDMDAIDTQMKVTDTTINDHIADLVDAHDSTAISTNGGVNFCTTSTTVEAYLDCIDANVGPVLLGGSVTIAGAQTITGAKTFSAVITGTSGLTITAGTTTLGALGTGLVHSNSTGILSSSLLLNADVDAAAAIARTKLASGTASHVLINDGSGVMSSEAQLASTRGGTGVSNAGTLTYGANNITLTTSGVTSLTVPTSGTVATLAGTETLTNKTLTGNTAVNLISGSGTLTLNTSGTITVPNGTDTLVGRATTDTLTNKTLTGNTAANLISGSGTLTLNTSGTITVPGATDTLVGRATTDTLTNKTLTAPVIASIVNSGTLTLPTSTDTLVGRATTDTLSNKTYSDSVTIAEIATPSTPASGFGRVYFKSDGNLYQLNDAGTESQVSAGAGTAVYVRVNANDGAITNGSYADITTWNDNEVESGSNFNTTTGVFTCPSNGKYEVHVQVYSDSATTGEYMGVKILHGSTDRAEFFGSSENGVTNSHAIAHTIVDCLATETIKTQMTTNAGSRNLNSTAIRNTLTITKLPGS